MLAESRTRPMSYDDDTSSLYSSINDAFYIHAREEPEMRCQRIFHGILIFCLMLSLQFRGQYVLKQPVPLPDWLTRSDFDGATIADFFEALYMFYLGFSIAVSVNSKHKYTLTFWGSFLLRILGLLGVGVLQNIIVISFEFSHVRYMGFFQRLVIVNILIMTMHLYFSKKFQYFCIGMMVLAYIGMVSTVQGSDTCEQGHIILSVPQCNGICFLDQHLLTSKHMEFQYCDSDGFFANLNVMAVAYMGYVFGSYLKQLASTNVKRLLTYWFISSLVMTLVGFLTKILWNFIPIIYTTNFSLLATGLAGFIVIIIFTIFDFLPGKAQQHSQRTLQVINFLIKVATPFKRLGGGNGVIILAVRQLVEALLVETGATVWIVDLLSFAGNWNGLVYNLAFALLCMAIACVLYHTNISPRF